MLANDSVTIKWKYNITINILQQENIPQSCALGGSKGAKNFIPYLDRTVITITLSVKVTSYLLCTC